jgi:hypothetical protein
VAKTTFGTECSVAFDRLNPAHLRRSHTVIHLPSGQRLPESFDVILKRVSSSPLKIGPATLTKKINYVSYRASV